MAMLAVQQSFLTSLAATDSLQLGMVMGRRWIYELLVLTSLPIRCLAKRRKRVVRRKLVEDTFSWYGLGSIGLP